MLDDNLIDFAEFLADEARKITKPLFRTDVKVDSKEDGSPVTKADKEVERVIRKTIENNFPDHGVYGEEFENQNTDKEFLWVIDPIDGTKSFIAGRPIFGTLISLLQNGKPVIGIIDQPIAEERWFAANGKTKFNNKEIKTRKCAALDKAIFGTTDPTLFEPAQIGLVENVKSSAANVIYGGDCYLYGQLAMGHIDLVVESGLQPFDYMALVPIVENAGGRMTDWNGNDLDFNSQGDVVACGDKALHKKIIKLL